ncbi:hypothetical protein ACHAW5_000928 [Stephanodiscus triporus]|uniref:Uncharacterized protein n=1 Tax=Stephanodiscus triporus TaxID=2934178 RepID=A0ABD3MSF8_9STRA
MAGGERRSEDDPTNGIVERAVGVGVGVVFDVDVDVGDERRASRVGRDLPGRDSRGGGGGGGGRTRKDGGAAGKMPYRRRLLATTMTTTDWTQSSFGTGRRSLPPENDGPRDAKFRVVVRHERQANAVRKRSGHSFLVGVVAVRRSRAAAAGRPTSRKRSGPSVADGSRRGNRNPDDRASDSETPKKPPSPQKLAMDEMSKEIHLRSKRRLLRRIAQAMDGTRCDDELSCMFERPIENLVEIDEDDRVGTGHEAGPILSAKREQELDCLGGGRTYGRRGASRTRGVAAASCVLPALGPVAQSRRRAPQGTVGQDRTNGEIGETTGGGGGGGRHRPGGGRDDCYREYSSGGCGCCPYDLVASHGGGGGEMGVKRLVLSLAVAAPGKKVQKAPLDSGTVIGKRGYSVRISWKTLFAGEDGDGSEFVGSFRAHVGKKKRGKNWEA